MCFRFMRRPSDCAGLSSSSHSSSNSETTFVPESEPPITKRHRSGQEPAGSTARSLPMTQHSLASLPTELVLRIASCLSADDLAHLSLTCRSLSSIIRTDDCWKPRIRALWRQHGLAAPEHYQQKLEQDIFDSPNVAVSDEGRDEQRQQSWWSLWQHLIGPYRKLLGVWASHLPFRGRLCTCHLTAASPRPAEAPLLDRLSIALYHVSGTNAATPADILSQLPQGAQVLDPHDTSFLLPFAHPSPDRGLSVDVFVPKLNLHPLLRINASWGPFLVAANTSTGVSMNPRSSMCAIPLDFDFNTSHQTTISKDLAVLGQSLQDALDEESLAGRFPTQSLVQLDALRVAPKYINEDTIETVALSWAPKASASAAPTPSATPPPTATASEAPRPEPIELPGPRIVYQTPPAERRPSRAPIAIQLVRNAPGDPDVPIVFRLGQNGQLVQQHQQHQPAAPQRRRPLDWGTLMAASDISTERFSPLQNWSCSQSFDARKSTDISPAHLKGFWAGTFGPHGIEFGYINARQEVREVRAQSPDSEEEAFVQQHEPARRVWVLDYVKITGDVNVPSGVVSWSCELPEDQEGQPTVPTVSKSDIDRWSYANVSSDEQTMLMRRWMAGTLPAHGQVAFSGFVQPKLTHTRVTFVRTPSLDGQGDVVNDIRFQWSELGKVSMFKRIEPSALSAAV